MDDEKAQVKPNKGLSGLLKAELFLFFTVLDVLLIGAGLLLVLSWLANPLYIDLPELPDASANEQPEPWAITFGWPILSITGGLLLLRLGTRKLANKLFFETPGLLDFTVVRYIAYFFGGLAACIFLLEFVLEKTGFEKELQQYQGPLDEKDRLDFGGYIQPDPFLMWTFTPNEKYLKGRVINREGFIGTLPPAVKADNVKRVFCLGGSTTSLPSPAYPDLLEERLNEQSILGFDWEVYNRAVDRYSISQGLSLFKRVIMNNPTNQPDIVTISFGWDDHWRGSVPDSLRMRLPESSERAPLLNRMMKRHVVQLISFNRQIDRVSARADNPDGLRVPATEYKYCLVELVRAIKAAGARPLIITAPRGELTKDLLAKGQARDLEQARKLHDTYNQIARTVCEEERVRLIDMVAWIRDDAPTRFAQEGVAAKPLVESDGIHLSTDGHRFLADLLVENLRE